MRPVPALSHGFTLIELMISLVLGLLISAAVIQIYLVNARTSATQQSGSELQDASMFGLQQLENKLRIANLGNNITTIDNETVGGGVVLSPLNIYLPIANKSFDSLFTNSADDASFVKPSNMSSANSDQLTIQYKNITDSPIADCESADVVKDEIAIERYFLRSSTTSGQGLVLACDAGRIGAAGIKSYTPSTDSKNFSVSTNGQEFIMGVDQFKILLGTQTNQAGTAGRMQYLTPKQYNDLATKPPIIAVKIGMIARGSTAVIGSSTKNTFSLFGTDYTLAAGQPKRVRNSYESTSLLRNARVVNVDISADLARN